MNTEIIKDMEILIKPYRPEFCNRYKAMYKQAFGKNSTVCNCYCSDVYKRLKAHYIE